MIYWRSQFTILIIGLLIVQNWDEQMILNATILVTSDTFYLCIPNIGHILQCQWSKWGDIGMDVKHHIDNLSILTSAVPWNPKEPHLDTLQHILNPSV